MLGSNLQTYQHSRKSLKWIRNSTRSPSKRRPTESQYNETHLFPEIVQMRVSSGDGRVSGEVVQALCYERVTGGCERVCCKSPCMCSQVWI